MGRGKIAAQVAHAAVSASDETRKLKSIWYKHWIEQGQKKIIVRTSSLAILYMK